MVEFARKLPQVSHREPAPADRDPIPAPYDNSYNNAERNDFHYVIKYHRDDRFLTEHMLDDATRASLDQAWTDLLSSFEYHNTFLRFVVRKFKLDLEEGRSIPNLSEDWIDGLPEEPRRFVKWLHEDYAAAQRALKAAQPGQVDDAIRLAELAWRRPLSEQEKFRLRSFYANLRDGSKLEHPKPSALCWRASWWRRRFSIGWKRRPQWNLQKRFRTPGLGSTGDSRGDSPGNEWRIISPKRRRFHRERLLHSGRRSPPGRRVARATRFDLHSRGVGTVPDRLRFPIGNSPAA